MKRVYTLGTPSDGTVVMIETAGTRLRLTQKKSNGGTKRSEKELADEAGVRAECERIIRDLTARGFVEQAALASTKAGRTSTAAKPSHEPGGPDLASLYQDIERPSRTEGPVIPRVAPGPIADSAPKKKKKKSSGKKKGKGRGESDGTLDKKVIAAVVAVAAACLGFVAFLVYDAALKPASIVGTWEGSNLDFEIGKPMVVTKYRLVLDESKRASMTVQEKFTSTGTYVVQGNLLKMSLKGEKDEDGEEGLSSEPQYKVAVGRSTLDLFDPKTAKKVVQLRRSREQPSAGGKSPAPAAPAEVSLEKGDEEADAPLASVDFSPKDNAFKLRHPPGWTFDTGSRPDNTYSWARFTKGSAKIRVFADIQGSLMSGSDSAGQFEEGSEMAPVHRAHDLYKRNASEEYSGYNESKPTLFKGPQSGEGRISAFTASAGGLFGSKLRGYRVTFLTRDRRVSILSDCPQEDFEKLKPTFLAVCRSVAR